MNINLTLIGQAISFALFVLFCMRFVWPPVINALRERQKSISDGLAAAEKAKDDLAKAQADAQRQLAEGRKQAEDIITAANKQAQHIVESAKLDAEKEARRIVTAARKEAEQSAKRVRNELVDVLGGLVSSGIAKILGKEVDMNRHKSILDSLRKELH